MNACRGGSTAFGQFPWLSFPEVARLCRSSAQDSSLSFCSLSSFLMVSLSISLPDSGNRRSFSKCCKRLRTSLPARVLQFQRPNGQSLQGW